MGVSEWGESIFSLLSACARMGCYNKMFVARESARKVCDGRLCDHTAFNLCILLRLNSGDDI